MPSLRKTWNLHWPHNRIIWSSMEPSVFGTTSCIFSESPLTTINSEQISLLFWKITSSRWETVSKKFRPKILSIMILTIKSKYFRISASSTRDFWKAKSRQLLLRKYVKTCFLQIYHQTQESWSTVSKPELQAEKQQLEESQPIQRKVELRLLKKHQVSTILSY